MNVKQIATIGAALLVAGGAFVWMRSQAAPPAPAATTAAAPAPASKTQVLVAKRDLGVGDRITPDAIGWTAWPDGGSSPAFFEQSKTPTAIEDFANAVVRQAMVAGEPITAAKLAVVNVETSTMAALLTPGMRATSVSITPDTGVAGFILPNDRVDVVLSRDVQIQESGGTRSEARSSTVLENVRVLAIDQALSQTKDQRSMGGSTATLELSSEDAQRLELADRLGDLSLVLRGYSDAAGPTMARFAEAPAMSQPGPRPAPAANSSGGGAPVPPLPSPDAATRPAVAAAAAQSVKIYRGGQ